MISKEAFCKTINAYKEFNDSMNKLNAIIRIGDESFIDEFSNNVIESLVLDIEGNVDDSIIWDWMFDDDFYIFIDKDRKAPQTAEELYDLLMLVYCSDNEKEVEFKYQCEKCFGF